MRGAHLLLAWVSILSACSVPTRGLESLQQTVGAPENASGGTSGVGDIGNGGLRFGISMSNLYGACESSVNPGGMTLQGSAHHGREVVVVAHTGACLVADFSGNYGGLVPFLSISVRGAAQNPVSGYAKVHLSCANGVCNFEAAQSDFREIGANALPHRGFEPGLYCLKAYFVDASGEVEMECAKNIELQHNGNYAGSRFPCRTPLYSSYPFLSDLN